MQNRSRIIRSIIAAIIAVLYIAIVILCINGLRKTSTNMSMYIKLIYIALCLLSVFLYTVVKKKLKLKILNKKLNYVYRYSYLAAIIFLSRLVMSYVNGVSFTGIMATQMLITLVNVIMIRHIVFNVSTSDILSAMAGIIYIFLPQTLFEKELLIVLNYKLIFVLAATLLLLKIIDEISQHRLKNKKYIYMSILFSMCIVATIFFGGNCLTWIIVVLITFLASKNIDFTHISFGQKNIDKYNSIKFKRLLYKIERININKIVVLIVITTIITVTMQFPIRIILKQELVLNFCSYSVFKDRIYELLRYSRNYYLIIVVITLITEFVAVFLRRKVDLKTTAIRSIFLMSIMNLLITSPKPYIYQIFDAMLILNLVLNISNIYYNREEKIKLLKEKN